MPDLPQSTIKELLDYDPVTGNFTWKLRPRKWFKSDSDCAAWNGRFAGKRAGNLSRQKSGYELVNICIQGSLYKAHRLAWVFMNGDNVPCAVDHKKRVASNNAWRNIRSSSPIHNGRNRSRSANNKSGVTGVCWSKNDGKWICRVKIKGKDIYLGSFDLEDLDIAAMEVMEFRSENNFDPEHGLFLRNSSLI